MQATRTLPTGYTVAGDITLKENRRLVILLNVLGIPWFILCAVFFIVMAALLGAFGAGGSGEFTLTITPLLVALVVLIVITFAILVLHEMVHGLFFWLFTRARPRFGFKGAYAYAAAPGWYIPRPQFLAVGLAPLLLISLVGLLILPLTAAPVSLVVIAALILNATGAIGDLYMVVRLLPTPRGVLIEDEGEGIRWFAPAR